MIVGPVLIGILLLSGIKSFQPLLQKTGLHLPVFLQSFRIIVELLIYGAFLEGVFPQRATFEGLNFDILVGISAPVIGWLILKKRIGFKKGLLIWNINSNADPFAYGLFLYLYLLF